MTTLDDENGSLDTNSAYESRPTFTISSLGPTIIPGFLKHVARVPSRAFNDQFLLHLSLLDLEHSYLLPSLDLFSVFNLFSKFA